VPESLPQYVETAEEKPGSWPRPVTLARVAQPPPRRAALDAVAVLLAVLGLAAAAGAAVWYLRLGHSDELTVPRVTGLREQAAVRTLTSEGFNVQAVERPASGRPGFVVAQRPRVSARLPHGTTVTIQVANGQKP
jgi:beta-lactam-binding protein with PASTA domain